MADQEQAEKHFAEMVRLNQISYGMPEGPARQAVEAQALKELEAYRALKEPEPPGLWPGMSPSGG